MKLIKNILLITTFTAIVIYAQNDFLIADNGINSFVEVDKFNNYHFLWNEYNGKPQYACYDSNLVLIKEIKPLPFSTDLTWCISLSLNDTLITASWLNYYSHSDSLYIVIEAFSLNSNRILLDSSKSFYVPPFARSNRSLYDGTWISDSLYLVVYNNFYEDSFADRITAQVFNLFSNNKSELYQLSDHLLDNSQQPSENIQITKLKTENTFLLTWTDLYNDHPNIWGRIYNINMLPSGDTFLINQPANYYREFSNIRINENQNNKIVFSWINTTYGDDGFGTNEIKWRWMDKGGNFLNDEQTISSENNIDMDLDIDKNNNIIFVLNKQDNTLIRGQRYLNNNQKFGFEFPISTSERTNSQFEPTAKFNNKKFITIWHELSQDATDYSYKLYSNIYEFSNPYLNFRELIDKVIINKSYLKPEGDSLYVSVKTKFNENFVLFADILDNGKNSIGKFQLFDDGRNGDLIANDSIFSNYFVIPTNLETYYSIDIQTALNESDTNSFVTKEAAFFTSVGPVTIKKLIYTSTDTIINPGELIRFKLGIENNGNYATAENITAQIFSDDSLIQGIQRNILNYSNITSGSIALPESEFVFRLNSNFNENRIIPFELKIFSNNNFYWSDSFYINVTALTTVDDNESNLPTEFNLFQNYPNPFNPTTTIGYSIPYGVGNDNIHSVRLKIYDVLGREVAFIVNEKQKPGNYFVQFDGSNFPSGIYYYQIKIGDYINTKKMVLLK